MLIIPVIDLQVGEVVHATGGQRAQYRPIVSTGVRSTRVEHVAQRLCEHCATERLYLADLDALQGRAPQFDAVNALLAAQPRLRLWLDAGYTRASDIDAWMRRLGAHAARVQPVLASESLASIAALREARRLWPKALLSLDSRDGVALDPGSVWSAPEAWPERVIAMELTRVGSLAGPGLEHLGKLQAQAPAAWWIGSGGIRDDADLVAAQASSAQAWLVASALHAGRIAPRRPMPQGATDCGDGDDAGHSVLRPARVMPP